MVVIQVVSNPGGGSPARVNILPLGRCASLTRAALCIDFNTKAPPMRPVEIKISPSKELRTRKFKPVCMPSKNKTHSCMCMHQGRDFLGAGNKYDIYAIDETLFSV